MSAGPGRRIVSMGFPRLPSEREARIRPADGPMALILRQNNAQSLYGLNAEAETPGLRPGMTLPEARAPCRRPTLPEPIGLVSDALLTRIGSRIGLDNIPCFRPLDSHIPKRALRLTQRAYVELSVASSFAFRPRLASRRAGPARCRTGATRHH